MIHIFDALVSAVRMVTWIGEFDDLMMKMVLQKLDVSIRSAWKAGVQSLGFRIYLPGLSHAIYRGPWHLSAYQFIPSEHALTAAFPNLGVPLFRAEPCCSVLPHQIGCSHWTFYHRNRAGNRSSLISYLRYKRPFYLLTLSQ